MMVFHQEKYTKIMHFKSKIKQFQIPFDSNKRYLWYSGDFKMFLILVDNIILCRQISMNIGIRDRFYIKKKNIMLFYFHPTLKDRTKH